MVDQIESNVEVPKTPKKRGRKPKNILNAEPVEKIPKKRGRKPKIKVDDNSVPKIPKKRGRKPKDSYLSKTNTTTIDTSSVKGTILHLKIKIECVK